MTGTNLNQIRHTLEQAEFHLQSPFGLTVERLRGHLGLGTIDHCEDLIKLCESKGLIEVEQISYSTAHVKSVTPLGKMVLVKLRTDIDKFDDRGHSIEAQLERLVSTVRQVNLGITLEPTRGLDNNPTLFKSKELT